MTSAAVAPASSRGAGSRGRGSPETGPGLVVARTVAEYAGVTDAARATGRTVGVVPTMGALHAGHRWLIEQAASECDVVVVTIFVNPTQFTDAGDLAAYPRTWEADLDLVASAGGSLVFAPTAGELYPAGTGPDGTVVSVPTLARRLEGASRPGHFDGVATVVVKLLAPAGRCRAYFGAKDYQQLLVVRRVVRDLALPVEVVGCETVREPDGLALSSRNVRLSGPERAAATVLYSALRTGALAISSGERHPGAVESVMATTVAAEPLATLDYAVVVDAFDLEPVATVSDPGSLRLLIAAEVGQVRLIDNLGPRSGG